MSRESRTLRALFPDPKPPSRKNFIKENVKNLRRMEKLIHEHDGTTNEIKLPILRHTRTINKSNGFGDNQVLEISNGLQKLKTSEITENRHISAPNYKLSSKNRKKSAPVLTTRKPGLNKLIRTSENQNLTRKRHNSLKEQADLKCKTQSKLKAYSAGNIIHDESSSNDENILHCKSQGVQTLDTQDTESLYSEGVIRYPSGRKKELQDSKTCDQDDARKTEDIEKQDDETFNRPQKEKISLANKLVSQLNNGAPPSSYRKGEVPKYIKERKEALKKEQVAKAAAKLSDCPIGHIPLPDHERKETLAMLKKNYQDYVNELNMLPIKTDTLRSQKRKMEIEKQLTKLEEALKVFSRPKVFVKIDS